MTWRLTRLLLVVLVVGVLVWPSGATAADLNGYRDAVAAAVAAVEADDAPGAAAALRAVDAVDLAGGVTVQPDTSPILAALESDPPDLDAAVTRLAALLDVLDRALAGAGPDAADAGAALREVLARDEFQPEEPEDPSPWERLRGWVRAQLERLSAWLGTSGSDSSAGWQLLNLLIAVAAVAAIGGVIYWVVRALRRQMGPDAVMATGATPEARLTSDAARAEAERLFQDGQFRAALRLRYLAALIRWEEAGRLRFDRSLTNREVLDRAAAHGDDSLVSRLTPLVERFDRIWYADLACTADDYQSFAQLADRAWEPVQ